MKSASSFRPQWQLPPGVPAGVWDYVHSESIANDYDDYFNNNPLFKLDETISRDFFERPGVVLDLGCGSGRALIPLARRGFTPVGVDLSLPMLRVVGEKSRQEKLSIHRVQANLVELDAFRDGAADYAVCLFSTLGMIRGAENRQTAMDHVYRILKPGGLFILHVHSVWHHLFTPLGRHWLVGRAWEKLLHRSGGQLGDKFYPYRGIPKMYLHTFTQTELTRLIGQSQFEPPRLLPLSAKEYRPLRFPWLFGRIRANGWIAVCRKKG